MTSEKDRPEKVYSRRVFVRNVGIGVAAVWAGPLLAACSRAAVPKRAQGGSAATQPTAGGTLRWYLPDDPPDLDPHMGTTSSLQWVLGMTYNGLLKYDVRPGNEPGSPGANTPVPDLAERWEQPDALTYLFYLRQGVKFHDGSELTAEDAAFSLNRIKTKDPQFQRAYAFDAVDRAEAADKYVVRVKMKQPYAAFINQVAAAYTHIAPKRVIEQNGDMKQSIIGTGPFKLKEYKRGNRFLLERNPDYFGKAPLLDTIEIRIMPDASAQLAAFNARQLDIYTAANGLEFEQLKKTIPGLGGSKYQQAYMNGIGFNLSKKPFDDIRVRQALWYGIDPEEIIKVVWNGDGWKHRAIPPALGDWAVPYEQLPLSDSPNIEKAKQLLKEAGYPNGLDVECKSVYRYTQKEAQVVVEQLKRIGVRMKLVDVEYGAFLNARNKGDFETIAFSLAPFGDAEDYGHAMFQTKASRNFGKWGTAELDKLFETARQEMDVSKRKGLYAQIQRELATQCYVLDLPRGYFYELWWPHVRNYLSAENPERGLAFHQAGIAK